MNRFQKPIRTLLVLLSLVGAAEVCQGQPSLGVSPAVTSNTYSGVITLNVSGLTNGEQVLVRKYLDLDGSGAVGPGEPLVDSFKIVDGGAMIIGGVTNINVPYDSNPSAGAITTTLNFVPEMVVENMVGHYVYQVVSPSGRFTPVTASFAVTNAALAQTVSGTVYTNGVALPYAVVVAQDQAANNPAGGTVSDSSGHYLLALPPGKYTLIAALPNYYFSFAQAPSVTLTNGAAATNDLYLTNGTTTISGRVYDAANSNGIAGVLMTAESGSLFAITFTDTNGNYSAAVAPSFWKIQPDKQRLPRRAYVLPEATFQVDATGGDVSNANIAVPKGNALFYGRVTDNLGQSFANVELTAYAGNVYNSKGYSDPQGYYAVAALGDVTNYWGCSVNSGKNTALGNYVMNNLNSTTLSPNQARLGNFVALPATAVISGRVLDNSGNPVSGVTLYAQASISGSEYSALDATTDNSGYYSLAVASGQWWVQFLTGGSSDNLDAHGYSDPYGQHPVNIPPDNVVLNLTVYPIGTPLISGAQWFGTSQFGFKIDGTPNLTYTVQVSTNLAATNWTSLFSLILTNSPFPVVDPHATNSPRFYRVLKN